MRSFTKSSFLCTPSFLDEEKFPVRWYAVNKHGQRRLLKEGEEPAPHETSFYGVDRIVRIPRIDNGEVFSGMSNKKRRVFKAALRTINTAGVEVGVVGHPLTVVEGLSHTPRTGEFEASILSSTDTESELIIHQSEPAPFHLTAITVHVDMED